MQLFRDLKIIVSKFVFKSVPSMHIQANEITLTIMHVYSSKLYAKFVKFLYFRKY